MPTDLRPHIGEYAGQGQTTMSEGAPAQYYNCTIECLRRTALDLHFKEPYDDEQLREAIASKYGYTGLPWGASVDIANDRIPGLAAVMSIESPADIVAQIRANVSEGWLQHCGFWCDRDAWVPAHGAVTYSHACRITADLGNGFALQNPEPHPDFTLTDAQVRALWDGGGLLVFKKSVLPGVAAAPPVRRYLGGRALLVPHPTDAKRMDMFVIATGGAVEHQWATDGSGLHAFINGTAHKESLGGVLAVGTLSATWDNAGGTLSVAGVSPTDRAGAPAGCGAMYGMVLPIAGGPHGWAKMKNAFGLLP